MCFYCRTFAAELQPGRAEILIVPPQAHYVRQLPQGDAFALCRKLSRYRQKPSPWGRWLDAKRQDGRGTSFQNKKPPRCVPRQSGGRWNAFFRLLLGCPVEVLAGQRTAHGGGVGIVEHLQVTGDVRLQFLAGQADDVAVGQCLFGDGGFCHHALLLA